MRVENINKRKKRESQQRLEALEKELADLIKQMLKDVSRVTPENIYRRNYLESQIEIMNINKAYQIKKRHGNK